MAHYQNQHSATPQTDEYGHLMRQTGQTDEYGNPVYQQTGMTGGTGGAHNTGFATATGITGHHQGKLHRSGSSSSSSSEDDGEGGRRKKGIGQKIKEKLPGKHQDQPHSQSTAATTTPGGGHGGGGVHEKKGIMDKIKDKIPGHRDDRHSA